MVITATEFKNNFSKYIGLLSSESYGNWWERNPAQY